MVQVFEEFLDGVRCVGFRKQFLYMQRIYYESTRNLTIQLWYSKQAVFSRFGGIWPLWKTSATEYLKYSTDIEGERRQSFDTPWRSTRFVFCNFLDRKFEWAMRYPSKISITLVKWWYWSETKIEVLWNDTFVLNTPSGSMTLFWPSKSVQLTDFYRFAIESHIYYSPAVPVFHGFTIASLLFGVAQHIRTIISSPNLL